MPKHGGYEVNLKVIVQGKKGQIYLITFDLRLQSRYDLDFHRY
jgi:hypothetical protein